MLRILLGNRLAPCAFLLLICPALAHANVVLTGTRLIYPAADREISVHARNPSDTPVLTQVWIDSGDPSQRAEASNAPFLIVPPMTRIEGQSTQVFRLMHIPSEQPLPEDRESVFYFNILDVPPKPDAEGASYMQFAYRTRVKLFYRPPSLLGSASTAPAKLTWSLVEDAHGPIQVEVHNPSAFHVSFHSLTLHVAGATYDIDGDMVLPYSTTRYGVDGLHSKPASASVRFKWINDFGSTAEAKAEIR